MSRIVLLSYLERNKPVTIPEGTKHIQFLRQEFLRNFKYSKNVRLGITFQRFDREWEDYIDLDDDATVENKDKLKVIVSPSLSDTSRCSTEIIEVLKCSTCIHLVACILMFHFILFIVFILAECF